VATASPPAPRRTATAAAAAQASTYPDHTADAALCKTYNADIASDDTLDIQTAVQDAAGSVSLKLAKDIEAVVNADGTVQQDEMTLIKVAEDCALVSVGKSPGN
ncbi:MAG: hypothetical protein ACRDPY_47915, partial [Streptosporangiaceae bacterium]